MSKENELTPVETLQKLISEGKVSSEVLAAQIVAYRCLKINKEITVLAMSELASRRAKGDDFDFEKYIETEVAKIPVIPDLDFQKLSGNLSLQTLTKMMKKPK